MKYLSLLNAILTHEITRVTQPAPRSLRFPAITLLSVI